MDGEAEVLQDRIEVTAFDRRRRKPGEGIGRGKDEQEEGGADGALHGEHIGTQGRRQIAAEDGNERAEEGEDEHPQQHRAFVIAPGAGDLVDHRLQRMRIFPHARHREVRIGIGAGQRPERQRRQHEAGQRHRATDGHHALIADPRADQGHRHLHQRQRESQNQREMSSLNHGCLQPLPCRQGSCPPKPPDAGSRPIYSLLLSCHTPLALSPSATSLGM